MALKIVISLVGCFDVSQSCVQLVVQGQRKREGHRGHGSPTDFGKYVHRIPVKGSDYAHHINNLMSVTCATRCSAEGSGRTRGTMLSYPRYSWSRKENRSRSKSGSRNRHSFTVVPRPTDPWNLHRLNCWYQDTWEIELEIG